MLTEAQRLASPTHYIYLTSRLDFCFTVVEFRCSLSTTTYLTNTAHWFYYHFFSLVLLHLFSRKPGLQPPVLQSCCPTPAWASLTWHHTQAALARCSSLVPRLLQLKRASSYQDTTILYCVAATGLWLADLFQQLSLFYTPLLWICTLTKICFSLSKS